MKKILILLLTFAVSCSIDDDVKEMERTIATEFSSKKFIGAKVAYKLNNEVKLGITEKELIKSFNNHSKKVELGKVALEFKVLNIEGKNYIRFYNEDKSVSTVALIGSSKNKFQKGARLMYLGKTVCTTTDCANCCGCVPKGDYCTSCDLNSSDCKRTTSN